MYRSIALIAILMAAPLIVNGQWVDSWGTGWNNPISQSLGNMLYQNVFYGTPLPINGSSSSGRSSSPNKSKAGGANPDRLVFQRSRNGRAAGDVVKAFKIKGVSDTDLLRFFVTINREYDRSAREVGAENNLAYAVTVFTLTMVQVCNGIEYGSDSLTERNVFDAISAKMAASPALDRMSDRDRQELHDRLVYSAGLIAAAYQVSRQERNAERVGFFQSMAGELLKSVYDADPKRFDIVNSRLIYR